MLDKNIKQAIQTSYSKFLQARELKPRYGQKLMIADIARIVGTIEYDNEGVRSGGQHICVVEAGTGTGKTVAYLLAVLPIAKALQKSVVVATATVALQEQIIFKDLPELKRHSELDFNFALAKGRGRYLCLTKLDRVLTEISTGQTIPLYEDEVSDIAAGEAALYRDMVDSLGRDEWDGDRDNWPDEIAATTWQRVTTDHRQCTSRRCSHVSQCAFFKAREQLGNVDCIVANHDLVLADLALGGGAILSVPEDTIYVFDEGHHLPEKTLNHFALHTRINGTSRWLEQSEKQWQELLPNFAEAVTVVKIAEPLGSALREARLKMDTLPSILEPLMALMDRNHAQTQVQTALRYRFSLGVIPDFLREVAATLAESFDEIENILTKLTMEVSNLLESNHSPLSQVDLENSYALLGTWQTRAEVNAALWSSYAHAETPSNPPTARWLTLMEMNDLQDVEVVSSPVLAANTLEKTLWSRCYSAVITSATLTALGSFERFQTRAGTPVDAHYGIVPSPFHFQDVASFEVPKTAVEANNVQAHTDNLIEYLPALLDGRGAALVLFASRRQMQEVFDALPQDLCEQILIQGSGSKQTLVKEHKQRIDQQKNSILFGLASFAEGLDLPGDYCRHVVIAKIPFAVPDDPVDAALAEWIEAQGGNAFMQISVPDAAVKMVQACGRLLRTETDSGTVTLLDKRIVTKRYGEAILNSLPPFTRVLNA